MAKFQDQYDSAFLGILQNEGNIAGFLDALFAFLFRRTDFYVEMRSKEDKMGFPPGIAEKITLQGFRKYEKEAKKQQELYKEQQRIANKKAEEKAAAKSNKTKASVESPAVNETSTESVTSTISDHPPNIPVPVEQTNVPVKQPNVNNAKISPNPELSMNTSNTSDSSTGDTVKHDNEMATAESTDDDEKLAREQMMFQANPDSYNGAVRDRYCWSQSIKDIDVKIFTPKHILKGKDVEVNIERHHLTARCRSQTGEFDTLLDGELAWEVDKEESMWSLDPGKYITVSMEKKQERWWDCVLKDEPKINVRKIEATRPMSDLDDEAQAKIEEMMYNEHQKRLGLPQSHEQKVHDMLKKGWDAEGSPFRGQPFDPSKLNVSADGTMNFGQPPTPP